MKVKSLSWVPLFVTLWTVAYQASPSMGFSRQEYQSGLPFPSPGHLPRPRDQTWVSCISESESEVAQSSVRLFATPWTVAYQASLSMGFPRKEYWSGLPFLSSDLPDPRIEFASFMSPALAGGFYH